VNAVALANVTRVEVIDEKGRSYVAWHDDLKVSASLQDDGRTLKLFVGRIGQPFNSSHSQGDAS
jgi:hypothetical protein